MSRCFATVITRSYLADARALATSIRRFHDDPIYVLCVDDPTGYFDPAAEPFTVLTLDDVLPQEDRPLVFYYTAFELCCAMRGYLHRWIHDHTTAEQWMFLDSDISVHAKLEPIFDLLCKPTAGLFTAHCLRPAPAHLLEPVETSLQRFGIYNGGFLALLRCDKAEEFIDWFIIRLRTLGFFMEHDVNCDQLWMNFLPEYFPEMHSLRHPGANVAYWNIHERQVTVNDGQLFADGQPLLFAHYSRWRIDRPHDFAWGRPIADGTDRAAIDALGDRYRSDLLAGDFHTCRSWPYGHARFRNGRAITKAMRRAYYAEWSQGSAKQGSPFDHPEWFSVFRYPPDIRAAVRRLLKPFRGR